MSKPNINVTYEEMRDAATKLTSGKDKITSELDWLRNYIGELVRSGFVTDQASVRFNEVYGEFTTNATGMISALDGIASYLTQAAQAMQDTDAQLAAGLA